MALITSVAGETHGRLHRVAHRAPEAAQLNGLVQLLSHLVVDLLQHRHILVGRNDALAHGLLAVVHGIDGRLGPLGLLGSRPPSIVGIMQLVLLLLVLLLL